MVVEVKHAVNMTPNPLKIAVLHFGFFYSGGGEKLVLEEVRGLRAMGHEVVCFAPYVDRDDCFPDYPEILEIKNLVPPPPSWLPFRHAICVLACCVLAPLLAPRFARAVGNSSCGSRTSTHRV